MPNQEEAFNKLVEEVDKWLMEKQMRSESSAETTRKADIQVNSPPMMTLPTPPSLVPASSAKATNHTVGDSDVLCGRGPHFQSDGNTRYHQFIGQYKVAYSFRDGAKRDELVNHVYREFRNQGGRFLKEDKATGGTREMTDSEAIEKISQGLQARSTSSPSTTTAPLSVKSISNATESIFSHGLNKFDVMSAKGKDRGVQMLAGNIRYGQLIQNYAGAYSRGTNSHKKEIIAQVHNWVRGRGGRFLKTDETGAIQELDEREVFVKIKNALVYRSRKHWTNAALPKELASGEMEQS